MAAWIQNRRGAGDGLAGSGSACWPLLWALDCSCNKALCILLGLTRDCCCWPWPAPGSELGWPSWRPAVLLAAAVLCLVWFGLTGWRASLYGAQALPPQLEGRDVLVTGLVAGMPQWHESGLRFRLALETASAQGVAVRLPEKIDLSWYSGPVVGAQTGVELQVQPQALRAGERWQMMVRLKAPHGASNPHGFDYELWLWEQGVQATGYVRAGRADPAPVRLADTPWYPVERLRQRLREQIFAAVPERSQAGLIAALVVGDQRAIERSDWDLFRATGVAHLMSISGLHITMFAWAAALAVGWLWRRSAGLCRLWPAPSAALLGACCWPAPTPCSAAGACQLSARCSCSPA